MSGGSFNYLYAKDAAALLAEVSVLQDMADLLSQKFPGSKAATDTAGLLQRLRALQEDLDSAPLRSLREDVWHSVEWWQSNDYDAEQASAAVAAYEAQAQH